MPDYPILQQNKPIGTLSVTQAGLFTVFSARAKADADRLRLAVCGEQARAYLGLMLPDGSDWLTLRKRLTRLERARLPDPILFAADETWDIPDAPARAPAPPQAQKSAPDDGLDVLWYSAPDGVLTTFDGKRMLIAIPADTPNLPRCARSTAGHTSFFRAELQFRRRRGILMARKNTKEHIGDENERSDREKARRAGPHDGGDPLYDRRLQPR